MPPRQIRYLWFIGNRRLDFGTYAGGFEAGIRGRGGLVEYGNENVYLGDWS